MIDFSTSRIGTSLVVSVVLALAGPAPAMAASVYVAVNGVDSGTCGDKAAPCRSISRGIDNATAGSKVIVGPGRYGDLDGDGILGGTGEEDGGACGGGLCMIDIDKSLQVLSSEGAFATIIDPGATGAPDFSVRLGAPGIVFGGSGKGFSVSPSAAPVSVIDVPAVATDAVVAGNIVTGDESFASGISSQADGARILNNRISLTYIGIIVSGDAAVLKGNSVARNEYGVSLAGTNHVLESNVVNGNATGLFLSSATGIVVTKSSFLANTVTGILTSPGSTGSVTGSNIVGNATEALNCGVEASLSAVSFAGNWWGDAAGPGADPADLACDVTGVVTPAAAAPSKVKLKGLR